MDKLRGMLFILVELCIFLTNGNCAPVETNSLKHADAIDYLKRFNYISDTASNTNIPPETLAKAVRKFQEMVRLKVTGELNMETLQSMKQPRCGFKDNTKKATGKYVAGEAWPKTELSWKIKKYASTKKLTKAQQKDAMTRAFDIWAKETQLKLNYVEKKNDQADININFVAGKHGDGNPFDGPEGVLAHAQFPTDGSVHFDDDENWLLGTKAENKGIELFVVASHEFGHALGLDHTNVPDAVMYPIYSYSSNLVLHQDDIDGIQALYGKKPKKGRKTGKTGKTGKPRKQK